MNERIRELELEAIAYADSKVPADNRYNDIYYSIIRRLLAELIARECAQLAMTQHHSTSPADYDEMDPYDKGCDDTASRISGLIRRIFGVEQ